ncbi:MAG: sigma-70 family RNA polymerase sigma factor [Paramuribaculum sp.]|nr:sigma-70 family RNA polymerase sigma factor [Paramuribaculum sp.]
MQNITKLADDQLVKAYQAGDNAAFDALLKRHQTRVFAYIKNIVKHDDIADDIFQETFVKAIMNIRQNRYSEDGKFASWITRIAHNLMIDHFRQEKSENLVTTDSTEVDILNRRDLCDGNIEDSLIESQIHSDVRRLVDALPESQREVLTMRFFRNMSFKEIADATDVSINTALGRMRYALLNIRRLAKANNIALSC